MRKRPEIPEDVFFDTAPARKAPEPEPADEPEPDVVDEVDEAEPGGNGQSDESEDDVLAKSMSNSGRTTRVKLSEARAERERIRSEREEARQAKEKVGESTSRVGRPPAQEGPKVAVTLYLTEPVAHLLEEVKFLLLTEYHVKTTKSAIADFAMRNGLEDLQAAADDLRRD
ncbi:MAG: hypothetical protein ACLFU7_12205 [Armatimonadota bacterium]